MRVLFTPYLNFWMHTCPNQPWVTKTLLKIHHLFWWCVQRILDLLLLLLFSWPPVCEMCQNYVVLMFQTQIGTPPDLGSVANCYLAMLLSTNLLFPPTTRYLPRGDIYSWPFLSLLLTILYPHNIIRPSVLYLILIILIYLYLKSYSTCPSPILCMTIPGHNFCCAKSRWGKIYFNFHISSDINRLHIPLHQSILLKN